MVFLAGFWIPAKASHLCHLWGEQASDKKGEHRHFSLFRLSHWKKKKERLKTKIIKWTQSISDVLFRGRRAGSLSSQVSASIFLSLLRKLLNLANHTALMMSASWLNISLICGRHTSRIGPLYSTLLSTFLVQQFSVLFLLMEQTFTQHWRFHQ